MRLAQEIFNYIFLIITSKTVIYVSGVSFPPIITRQPSSEVLFHESKDPNVHDEFTISCGIGDQWTTLIDLSEPLFYWEKNGHPFNWKRSERIVKGNQGDLIFKHPTSEDVGVYRCYAINELGISMSRDSVVRKWELGNFSGKRNIINHNISEPNYVKLECNISNSYPEAKATWHTLKNGTTKLIKNSLNFAIDEYNNLWIINATRDYDGKVFVCIVTSKYLSKIDNKLLTKSQVGPKNVINFSKVENELNENDDDLPIKLYATEVVYAEQHKPTNLKLSCIYYSRNDIKVIWYSNGDRLTCMDCNNYIFTETNSYKSDRNFSCEIINFLGKVLVYHNTTLKVWHKPRLSNYHADISHFEEFSESFLCHFDGMPKPDIEWFFNGKSITQALNNDRRLIYETNITILNTQPSDNYGIYGCRASNDYGSEYLEYTFFSSYIPVVIKKSEPVIAIEGTSVNLLCLMMIINTEININWFYNGKKLTNNDVYELPFPELLTIKKITQNNAGEYKCDVSNEYGSDNGIQLLKVLKPTRIIFQTETILAHLGKSVEFECEIDYDTYYDEIAEIPKVVWFFNNKLISKYNSNGNSHSSILRIYGVSESDIGNYQCVVTTIHEEITSDNAELILIGDASDNDLY